MRPELVALLVCPECGGALDLRPFEAVAGGGDEIEEGVLRCVACDRAYPVTEGIPRLLPHVARRYPRFYARFAAELRALGAGRPDAREARGFEKLHRLTARAFGYEWNVYRTTSSAEDVLTLFWLTGIDPALYRKLAVIDVFTHVPTAADLGRIDASGVAGATILDVGCGMGKYLAVVSEHAKTVVGLDLSDALVRARAVVRDRANVHLVQGNILVPPLARAAFDLVYSVGVLHHTPDAHAAFRRSASLVKPGGRLAVWLYPADPGASRYVRSVRFVQDDVLRPLTCRLPPRLLRVVAGGLGRLTFVRDRAAARSRATGSRLARIVAAGADAVAVGRHPDPEIAAFLNFDWYAPQYRSYHSEDEVRRWYAEAGFDALTLLPQRVSAVGTRRHDGVGPLA
jgi:SAM-dependent methyltransferase/uncharacterized protein YbaR (Trm112 family)